MIMVEKNKLLGLEVIRFLSAFFVLFAHYHFLCDIGIRHAVLSTTFYPFYHSLPLLYFLSEWSVRIFWCISGFIFFWKYQTLIADRTVSFWDFFISRFARLYPLHLATLCLIAIGQAVYFRLTGFHFLNDVNYSAPYFFAQVFMAGNRIFTADSFNWPIWSVSIEVSVYLLFYFITRFVTRSLLFHGLIVLLFIFVSTTIPKTPLMGLFECLLFFYLGGAAAIVKKHVLQKNLPTHLAWLGVAIVPLFFWLTGCFNSPRTVYLFWSIWLPLLLFCASGDLKVNATARKIIETLGNMTYSSYLIHLPVQLIAAIICFQWKIHLPVFHPLFLIGYLCFIFGLSYCVYKYFERPMKETIKSAAQNVKPLKWTSPLVISGSLGIVIYLCLSYFPVVSHIDQYIKARWPSTLSPDNDHTKSGKALLDAGQYSAALVTYQKAIARYPYDPDDYANLGVVHYKLGNSPEAIKNLDRALALNPNYFMVYNNRGAIFSTQGRYDLALKDFKQAITVDPCPDPLLKRIHLKKEPGNAAAASNEPQNILCQDSAQLYSNLSAIETLQKDYASAIVHLSQAIARNPNSAKDYESRAICFFKLKDFVRSRQDTQKAISLGLKVDPKLKF